MTTLAKTAQTTEGVPFPPPKLAGGVPRVVPDAFADGFQAERKTLCMKEEVAEANEDREEQQFQRIDQMIADLRGDEVKAESRSNGQSHQRG